MKAVQISVIMAALVMGGSSLASGDYAMPATRPYVATLITEEVESRRVADGVLLRRLAAMNTTLALVRTSVDNLASNLQYAAETLSEQQLASLVDAVSNVSSNLSERAAQLQLALQDLVDTAAAVHLSSKWADRCIIDLGVLTPAVSNEYRLASWPTMQHDGRVRQYMATFSVATAGFLRLPANSRADQDCRVYPGTCVLACMDMNQWFFIQLRNLDE